MASVGSRFGLYGLGFLLAPILLIDMNFKVTTDKYHEFMGRLIGFLMCLLCYILYYELSTAAAYKISAIAATGVALLGPTYAALYLSPVRPLAIGRELAQDVGNPAAVHLLQLCTYCSRALTAAVHLLDRPAFRAHARLRRSKPPPATCPPTSSSSSAVSSPPSAPERGEPQSGDANTLASVERVACKCQVSRNHGHARARLVNEQQQQRSFAARPRGATPSSRT